MSFLLLAVVIQSGALLSSCASNPVVKAFNGSYSPIKETRTITEYCVSCHAHKDFDGINHMDAAPRLYTKKPHSTATRCVTCHDMDIDIWFNETRTTTRPDGVTTDDGE
jgi:cytochrome c553